MDTRVITLLIGIIGAAFGVAAVAADAPGLGAVAGGAALLAGLTALVGTRTAPATDPDAQQKRTERDELLDRTREDLAIAHERIAELEAAQLIGQEPSGTPATNGVVMDTTGADAAALTDPASQLFSEAYFRVALQSRLASARRHLRPVAVVPGRGRRGPGRGTAQRRAGAPGGRGHPSDAAGRRHRLPTDDGSFAIILEDTPENGAVWTVERIRRNLVSRFGPHTMWAGVACYPAHAFSTEELLDQARLALEAAQEWKQDRIEVAVAE